MASTNAFLVVVLLCFVSLASCNEGPKLTENGTIDWNDNFPDDSSEGSDLKTEYDAKGLQPWYDFVNSFISTVLNKEPYGKFVECFAFVSCSVTGGETKTPFLYRFRESWVDIMLKNKTEQTC